MEEKNLSRIIEKINSFLKQNKSYRISEKDYGLTLGAFERISKRYENDKKERSNEKIEIIETKPRKSIINIESKKKQSKKSNAKLNSKGVFDSKFQNKKSERSLDGSKEFYKIRDNGRFGSYSAYDNMDDESMP